MQDLAERSGGADDSQGRMAGAHRTLLALARPVIDVREISAGTTVLAVPALQALRPCFVPAQPVDVIDERLRPERHRLVGVFDEEFESAAAIAGFRTTSAEVFARTAPSSTWTGPWVLIAKRPYRLCLRHHRRISAHASTASSHGTRSLLEALAASHASTESPAAGVEPRRRAVARAHPH